jgi:hypothetical protein
VDDNAAGTQLVERRLHDPASNRAVLFEHPEGFESIRRHCDISRVIASQTRL